MHTYVIKVLLKSKVSAAILNKVNFIKVCFLTNYENNVLIRDRLIVKPSSNVVWTSMNARIWLCLGIPGVSQENVSQKLTLQKISELLGYFDLCFNHSSLFRLYFWKVVDVWLCKLLLPPFKNESNL
jgi:hypothetical protein